MAGLHVHERVATAWVWWSRLAHVREMQGGIPAATSPPPFAAAAVHGGRMLLSRYSGSPKNQTRCRKNMVAMVTTTVEFFVEPKEPHRALKKQGTCPSRSVATQHQHAPTSITARHGRRAPRGPTYNAVRSGWRLLQRTPTSAARPCRPHPLPPCPVLLDLQPHRRHLGR